MGFVGLVEKPCETQLYRSVPAVFSFSLPAKSMRKASDITMAVSVPPPQHSRIRGTRHDVASMASAAAGLAKVCQVCRWF